jgi:MinD-like ATPase involved in chromosome partitioning or flagellar assembly
MNDMVNRPSGQIITFYSYKGGTGRTMALANLAFLLARPDPARGQATPPRVLAIDWDFEAPGLHRYFQRYLEPESAKRFEGAKGCLELFQHLGSERSTYDPQNFVGNRQRARSWFEALNLEPYLLATSFPGLSLIKAGLFDDHYARRVSEFDWDDLFHATVGLFAGFADFLRAQFDYVLVDSRTGITDTSGICTMLLPDKLVVVFTPNQQSLTGIESLARKAVAYRKGSPDGRPLTVFPLPSRVETARPQLLEAWRNGGSTDPSTAALLPAEMSGYQPTFERLFAQIYARPEIHLGEYFDEVMLQHIPDYAYGEPVAVVLETSDTRISLSRSYSAFRDRLIELDVPWSSLTSVRLERDIVRRCEAIAQDLKKGAIEEAIRLAFALIEHPPPEPLFERCTNAIFDVARAVHPRNGEAASALIRQWTQLAMAGGDIAPSTLGQALLNAGKLSLEFGDLPLATDLLEASHERFSACFGAEHPATLMAMNQMASAARARGDIGKAHALYEKALEIRRRVLGDEHPETLESMSNLALTLRDQGDLAAARALQEQVQETYRRVLGNERPETLEAMSNLALTLREQGDLSTALALLKQALEKYRRLLGEEHPDTLRSMANLAEIVRAQGSGLPMISDKVRASFEPVMKALGLVRRDLSAVKDVVLVRPGYGYPPTGDPVPAFVVAVTPGTAPVRASNLQNKFGIAFAVTDATVEEQKAAATRERHVSFGFPEGPTASTFEKVLGGEELLDFTAPKIGSYEEPDPPNLPLVKEKMDLTICVSPEAGWSELESFLGETKETLTVAMHQFTAPHIFKAIEDAMTPAECKFELILHPIPEKPAKNGVKADDLNEEEDVINPFEEKMKKRFEQTWATLVSKANPDGLFASAYHIKVAVRDSSALWLSSGNWQSSNLPDVHPFVDHPEDLPAQFQRKYNRDYHAVINNQKLASIYEFYIKRDFELSAAQAELAESFAPPDLFVPEEEEEPVSFAAPPQLFPPLRLNRKVSVQPLLTPDNYAQNALKVIRSAAKSVWFQNQYIDFRGTNEDFAEFQLLVGALKDKIDRKLDVRIICRDMMKQESLDVLIALGFPKEVFRFQPACNNKTIIVDGKTVMFGSHTWSNEGVKTNRDASLIFYDQEIASYLAQIYDYDWNRLATARPQSRRPRVAGHDEETPRGFKRVPFSAMFDD